jgi:hypothetical protein
VRRRLEEEYGVSLAGRKEEINRIIERVLGGELGSGMGTGFGLELTDGNAV